MDVHSIYKITNIVNGKFYIGKAKDVDRRWKEHLRNVGKKRHPLYDGILHYGVENFKVEILHSNIPGSKIDTLELKTIVETQAIEKGYNLAEGGEGGNTRAGWTEERWEKYYRENGYTNYRDKRNTNLEIYKRIPGLYEKLVSEKLNTLEAVKVRRSAGILTPGELDAYRAVKIRKGAGIFTPGEIQGFKKLKESHNTPEMKALKSKNALGKNNSQWCGYFQVYLPDGTLLKEYDTAAEAAKELKTTPHGLRVKARSGEPYERGKYKGYTFKFRKP